MIKDETGNKYGRLTVIRRATEDEYPRGSGKPAMWLCQCECGNTTFAEGRGLRSGSRVSCGCLSREKAKDLAKNLGENNRLNLVGKRFGKLLVITLAQTNPTKWKCRCDCGAQSLVLTANLLNGHTSSCGCARNFAGGRASKGEEKITLLLRKSPYRFEREKTFSGLVGTSGKSLRFDFAVYNDNGSLLCLIEFHGKQHYEKVDYFQKKRADFLKRQEYDRKKISYCLANNIKLFTIPYWELDNINSYESLFQSQFLVKSKWHNDYLIPK